MAGTQEVLRDAEVDHKESKPNDAVMVHSLSPSKASSITMSDSTSTTSAELKPVELPSKIQPRPIRNLRHNILNVYRRIFGIIFLANLGCMIFVLVRKYDLPSGRLTDVATAAAANTLLTILIRQDFVINTLFKICWNSTWCPIRIRRMLAKIYEFGGVHSGAGVSSLLWFTALTALLTKDWVDNALRSWPIIVVDWVLFVLLLLIVIFAYPSLRSKNHNTFEHIHRWAGWVSIGVFWAEVMLFVNVLAGVHHKSYGLALVTFPPFWMLLVTTGFIILPWLRLRKLYMQPEALSDHCVRMHFTEPMNPFVVHRIAESPLGEWHPFACLPNPEGPGGSIIVSKAGDFTARTIANPRPYYWVRGIPTTGVMGMVQLFKSAVIVTTGSGIGPCLGFVVDMDTKCRMLWSTPNPVHTFGQHVIDDVKAIDKDAIIWDTKKSGRPDMVELAYQLYIQSGAEAVFVLSNSKLTRKVVYGMESRGVPAFGPIWDS